MNFIITNEYTKDVPNLIPETATIIEGKLQEYLKEKNYSESITLLLIPMRVINPLLGFDNFFKPIAKFRKKDKQVIISSKIPFEKIINSNEKDIYNIICNGILETIKNINLLEIKGFDFELLHADIENYCKENNWL